MVANRLSRTGASWAQIFEVYNSGTYNNQWMVVDYEQVGMPFMWSVMIFLILIKKVQPKRGFENLWEHFYSPFWILLCLIYIEFYVKLLYVCLQKESRAGILHVLEQLPGFVEQADVTSVFLDTGKGSRKKCFFFL